MTRHGLKMFALVTAVAAAAACDSSQNAVTSPAPAPRLATIKGFVILDGPNGQQWAMLVGAGKAQETQSAVIDQDGGVIRISGTELSVPRDAVKGPTLFTVTMKTQPYLTAQLTAVTQPSGRDRSQPQELHTFNGHYLTLTIDYARGFSAKDLPSPDVLKLLWVQNDRVIEAEETVVQATRRSLVAKLWHFTDYSPGIPRSALDLE